MRLSGDINLSQGITPQQNQTQTVYSKRRCKPNTARDVSS